GNGSNASFHIVDFVGVKLVGYNANGKESDRYIDLQFQMVVAQGECCDRGSFSGVSGVHVCSGDHAGLDPSKCWSSAVPSADRKGAIMSSRRRVLGIVVAVALAVVGTLALVAYVNGAEDRALAGERVVDVYVVTQPITAGTASDELTGKVKREQVPAKVQASGAVTKLSDINGSVASVDLVAGEQLLKSRFA